MVSGGPLTEEMRKREEQKASTMMTIIIFIIGLSVILSYNWSNLPNRNLFDSTTIFFGILVAAIIFIAARASRRDFGLRFCPACGRQIPFDAQLCPYCGHRLP